LDYLRTLLPPLGFKQEYFAHEYVDDKTAIRTGTALFGNKIFADAVPL
jgi:hypothetical protein